MASLLDKIKSSLLISTREKDEVGLRTLKVLLGELKYKEIELRGVGKEITDADVVAVIQKGIKSRTEAAELYKKGSREDLVKKEQEEVAVLKTYLPEQMSTEDVQGVIEAAIAKTGAVSVKDMGAVMAGLKTQLAGKADMGEVGKRVKEILVK